MTEVQSSPAPKKHNLHEFSNTHFHLLIVADDQDVNKALLERAKLAAPISSVLVDLSPIRDTSGRARGIAVDKLLAAAAKAHPDSELIVATSAPAAFAGAMVKGEDNSFARGALQNIIDGLLGFRTLNLLDSITVYAGALKKSHWFSSAMPAWSKLQHPKAEPKPVKVHGNFKVAGGRVEVSRGGPARMTKTAGELAAEQGVEVILEKQTKGTAEAKLGGKLAGVKGSQGYTNPWLAFGFNEGPEDDRNQHVAFDSLFDHHAKARMGLDVLSLDEIVETARLITSLEGSAAPHEISNKQTLARLIGAVRRSLAGERYAEQLSDLLFALKAEQAGGNDIRKQIMMVVETGAIKYVAVANRRPLLATVFEGLHRRVKGALRRRKQVADQKKAQAEPAPVVEAPAKKKKKRKKKVEQASTEQPFESRFAAKILDTDQPTLSEQEYQARKQQLLDARKTHSEEATPQPAAELAQTEEK
jgi:hypothetical protein